MSPSTSNKAALTRKTCSEQTSVSSKRLPHFTSTNILHFTIPPTSPRKDEGFFRRCTCFGLAYFVPLAQHHVCSPAHSGLFSVNRSCLALKVGHRMSFMLNSMLLPEDMSKRDFCFCFVVFCPPLITKSWAGFKFNVHT